MLLVKIDAIVGKNRGHCGKKNRCHCCKNKFHCCKKQISLLVKIDVIVVKIDFIFVKNRFYCYHHRLLIHNKSLKKSKLILRKMVLKINRNSSTKENTLNDWTFQSNQNLLNILCYLLTSWRYCKTTALLKCRNMCHPHARGSVFHSGSITKDMFNYSIFQIHEQIICFRLLPLLESYTIWPQVC